MTNPRSAKTRDWRRRGWRALPDVRAAFASSYDPRRPIEEQLRQLYRDLVTAAGGRSWHVHDSRRSDTGWPDESTVIGNRLFYVELKGPGAKPTPAQAECHQLLVRAGQIVYVFTSTGDRGRDQVALSALLGEVRR